MKEQARVLLVDDDPSGLAMLGLSLRQAGLSVATAAGGREALAVLQKERFDWLITDARMLPVNGFQLSVEAKRLQPHLRILMISAVYVERDIAMYPIERIFSKPVSIESMVRWIKKAADPQRHSPRFAPKRAAGP